MTDNRKLLGCKLLDTSSQRALDGLSGGRSRRGAPSPAALAANGGVRFGIGVAAALLCACAATLGACGSVGGDTSSEAAESASGASGAGGAGGGGTGGNSSSCDEDPSDNPSVLRDECGVFVKPDGSDASGDGTEKNPLMTLGKAIEIAAEQGKRVFACRGSYMEAVTVPGGAALYGGLDCSAAEWAPSTGEKSEILGPVDMIALRLLGGAGAATISIDRFSVKAPSAQAPGGSSVASLAEEGAVVIMTNAELVSGNGAPGAAGMSADAVPPATPQPTGDNAGNPACETVDTTMPGEMLMNDCGGGEISIGGAGGPSTLFAGQGGDDGFPDFMLPSYGNGGAGDTACGSGGFGQDGAPGMTGAPGAPGEGLGVLSAAVGYVGASGGEGGKGTIGQGGGGGGGRKGAAGCGAGASGGAGGAGGCGGLGGKGGQAGGSSIALISIKASVTLTDVVLTPGQGGSGGIGGNRQSGGLGSPGSLGGQGAFGLPSACKGGAGGSGGSGGTGGGGAGGHALGVAFAGSAPTGAFKVSQPLVAGLGAVGGNNGFELNTGAAGRAEEMLEFPSP
jgi:hypothetical protein